MTLAELPQHMAAEISDRVRDLAEGCNAAAENAPLTA